MIDGLFESIEGQRQENLTTEVLAYLLRSPDFTQLQKLFHELLLGDRRFLSSQERDFEISTQDSQEDGRPDLTIVGMDTRIIIENKLTAGFTPKQLFRYYEQLKSKEERQKLLVLLYPNVWKPEYQRSVVQQFESKGTIQSFEDLVQVLRTENIQFVALTWEQLIAVIESNETLVREFVKFVRSRYLISISLDEAEHQLLMDPKIPLLIEKLFSCVDRVREELISLGVKPRGKMGTSHNFYGFSFNWDHPNYWFGYSLKRWISMGTPLVIQIYPPFPFVEDEARKESLIAAGFHPEGGSWFFKCHFPKDEEHAAALIAQSIFDVLNKLGPQIEPTSPPAGEPLPNIPA